MGWYIWWGIAFAILLATVVDAFVVSKLRYKRKRLLTPNRTLILGTFVSAAVLFCPLYLEVFTDSVGIVEWGKSILIAIQHSIRLFAFDGDYMDIVDSVADLAPTVQMLYTALGAFLYFFAPMLTFSLILSFFQNISAHRKYVLSFWKHTHVFSELNEKSLALASSIDEAYNKIGTGKRRRWRFFRRALIVFTDVLDTDDEESLDLFEEAKEIGAILFSKDLESIRYRFKRMSFRKVDFYLISDDEEEKIRHAEGIMREYDMEGVELRVFSDDIRSELLLAAKNVQRMRVIRVNDIQSLIYHNLDVHGLRLFQNARSVSDTERVISAVIVGLGKYGIEMMKALTWFCQMDGYKIKINAFDIDEHAREHFTNLCPELMSEKLNGREIPGEARYEINIHGGIDSNSLAFADALAEITDATYIFVCLGTDEDNLATAVRIRSLCERVRGTHDSFTPDIETVIYDPNIRNTMGVKWDEGAEEENIDGVTNFKKQSYHLHMIGDLKHFYSVATLIDSELVEAGKQVHLRWGDESEFWKFEYNYRSSVAKAIHERLRAKINLDIPGASKDWNSRTQDEKLAIGKIEHVRWNAYMRTEGYQFSGNKEKTSRNDLGKLHHNLVPVTELTDEDLRKDA